MRFLTPSTHHSTRTGIRNDKVGRGPGKRGWAAYYFSLSTNHLCRPAPLPIDLQVLVIPNHVSEVMGGSGEESHVRMVLDFIVIKEK